MAKQKRMVFIIILIYIIYFFIGFFTNTLGPLIPDIIASFRLSFTIAAVLPFALFISYGIVSIPAGMYLERIGEKTLLLASFALLFVSSVLLALFPSYLTSVMTLFLYGTGMAAVQVVLNPLLRIAGGEEHFGFNLTVVQLTFSFASYLGPFLYMYLVSNMFRTRSGKSGFIAVLERIVRPGLPWTGLYWIFAFVCAGLLIWSGFVRFPKVNLKQEEKTASLSLYVSLVKNRTTILFFIAMFMYTGIEQGIVNWLSEFLNTYHGYDPQTKGAEAVSWFWGAFTLGSFMGLVLLKLFDSKHILITLCCLVYVSLSLALFGGPALSFAMFPVTGLFLAPMWSIIYSLGMNSVTSHHGAYSGILNTGVVGAAVFPLIIGAVGDAFGLRVGLFVPLAGLAFVMSVGFWAKPLIQNKRIRWAERVEGRNAP